MRRTAAVALVAVAIVLAACGGQSKSDKASSQVCDARADISKQVDTLKGITVSTATTSQIQSSLRAIGNDLKQIADAQGDLKGQRKDQVQAANSAFKSQVSDITSTLLKSTSLDQAKTQLTTALQQLGNSYKETFAKVDC